MRVTNNMLVNNLVSNVNRNLVNMSKKQDQLATGKKVHTASDDPVAASKIIKYRTDIAEYGQYERNTSDALSWLETTESTMMDINKVLQKARELTVKAANGTSTGDDIKKIGDEMRQLKNQIIMDANFSFAGRYVFSGYNTQEKLFNDDGTYKIGMTDIDINNPPTTRYQIGVGEEIKISTNGIDLFGYIPEEGPFVEKMPNELSADGIQSTKAEFKGDFSLNSDYTGTQITIDVDGQTYDLDMSNLDLSWVDTTKVSDVNSAKAIITAALKNAPANPVTVPQTKLSDSVDVYYDENDKLVLRSKNYGVVSISQTSGTSLGLTQDVPGNSTVEASLSMLQITDAEVGENFDNKEFLVTLNGKTERVTIGNVNPPQSVADLVVSLQSAFDSTYPVGSITVTEAAGVITFTTSGTSDGEIPSLEIHPVKAIKSKMIQDFDDVIEAIDNNDRDIVGAFITKMDEHMGKILTNLSDIGARTNRMELVVSRINENNITFTKLLSNSQDADMSEVIMYLKNSENVYRASLSAGARVIQPSLIDFLR